MTCLLTSSHTVPVRPDLQLRPTTESAFFGKASVESQRKKTWPTTLFVGPNMADVARPTTRWSSAARSRSCAPSWSWGEQSQSLGSRSVTEMLMDCVPDWGRHLSKVTMLKNSGSVFLKQHGWLPVWASRQQKNETELWFNHRQCDALPLIQFGVLCQRYSAVKLCFRPLHSDSLTPLPGVGTIKPTEDIFGSVWLEGLLTVRWSTSTVTCGFCWPSSAARQPQDNVRQTQHVPLYKYCNLIKFKWRICTARMRWYTLCLRQFEWSGEDLSEEALETEAT